MPRIPPYAEGYCVDDASQSDCLGYLAQCEEAKAAQRKFVLRSESNQQLEVSSYEECKKSALKSVTLGKPLKPLSKPADFVPLEKVKTFLYILNNFEPKGGVSALKKNYDMVIITSPNTVAGRENYDSKWLVAHLRQRHGSVYGYVPAGAVPSTFIRYDELKEKNVFLCEDPAGFGGQIVKFWDENWVSTLREVVEQMAKDGFDGIVLDWVAAFELEVVIKALAREKSLTVEKAEELAKYEIVFLIFKLGAAAKAINPNFKVLLNNPMDLGMHVPNILDLIDGVVTESIVYSGNPISGGKFEWGKRQPDAASKDIIKTYSCYIKNGKPVFAIEYLDPKNVSAVKEVRKLLEGFRLLFTTPLLDAEIIN